MRCEDAELSRLVRGVRDAGSWAMWMGVFNSSWMRLLQYGGMSYQRARTLTGKLCGVISQCRSEIATARRARSQKSRDEARAERAAQVDGDLRRLWGLYVPWNRWLS